LCLRGSSFAQPFSYEIPGLIIYTAEVPKAYPGKIKFIDGSQMCARALGVACVEQMQDSLSIRVEINGEPVIPKPGLL
jgi:hypothetical protein